MIHEDTKENVEYLLRGSLFGAIDARFNTAFVAPLIEGDERVWIIVSLYSLGDTFLLCGHLKTFRATHAPSGERVFVVIKKSHIAIASMFRSDFDRLYVVEDKDLDAVAEHLVLYGIKSGFGTGQGLFMHPHHINDTRVDDFTNIDGVSQANLYAHLLRLPIRSPLTPPKIDASVTKGEVEALAARHALVPGKSVILFPDTNSWPGRIPDVFWESLSLQLAKAGWSVFTNASGNRHRGARTAGFGGGQLINIPLHLVLPVLEYAGWMIGANCGLTSVVIAARTQCRKTLLVRGPAHGKELIFNSHIRLKSAYPYGYHRTFDGYDYDIEEYQIRDDDDFPRRASLIANGYNALSAAVPTSAPRSSVKAEFSPGDLIDRITILEVKLEKLEPAKLAYVNLELELLRDSLFAHFGDLPPEAIAQMTRLRDLNRSGWEYNEIIYTQFDDPHFGTAAWSLIPENVSDVMESERCIKAIRASQAANRDRIVVKNRLNSLLSSSRQEKKSFET